MNVSFTKTGKLTKARNLMQKELLVPLKVLICMRLIMGKTLTLFCQTHFRSREVERLPCNLKVPSLIPGNECQLWDFHWPTHSARVLV